MSAVSWLLWTAAIAVVFLAYLRVDLAVWLRRRTGGAR